MKIFIKPGRVEVLFAETFTNLNGEPLDVATSLDMLPLEKKIEI